MNQSLIPAFINVFENVECTLFVSILEVRYESRKSILYDLVAGHTGEAAPIANSGQRSAHLIWGNNDHPEGTGSVHSIHNLIAMAQGRKMSDERTVANPGSKGKGSSASSRSEMTIMIVSLQCS
jgi:hypothetical protein